MPGLKISAMVPAPDVADTDAFVMERGAVPPNYQATRAQILTAQAGLDIGLHADNAYVNVYPDGVDIIGNPGGADDIRINIGAGGLDVFPDQTVSLFSNVFPAAGGAVQIHAGPGPFPAGDPTHNLWIDWFGDPSHWAGGPDFYLFDNLNRLAAAVAGLLGGPIP